MTYTQRLNNARRYEWFWLLLSRLMLALGLLGAGMAWFSELALLAEPMSVLAFIYSGLHGVLLLSSFMLAVGVLVRVVALLVVLDLIILGFCLWIVPIATSLVFVQPNELTILAWFALAGAKPLLLANGVMLLYGTLALGLFFHGGGASSLDAYFLKTILPRLMR